MTQDGTRLGTESFSRYAEFQVMSRLVSRLMSRLVSRLMSRLKDRLRLYESKSKENNRTSEVSRLSLESTHESTQALVSRLKVQLRS